MRLCGIITKRKAHCVEIVNAKITDKSSIKNLLQTYASGKKRKKYRWVSIPTCKYGFGPHLLGMKKTRASLACCLVKAQLLVLNHYKNATNL